MSQRGAKPYGRVMHEIRLAWKPEVIHRTFASVGMSDRWAVANPRSIQALEDVLRIALDFYGTDSHWIEKRGQPGDE